MAGKNQTLSFTIELPIAGTKDLKPPKLECKCQIEMATDENHERALWAYYKKYFENKLREKLKAQLKHYGVPLQSMQKEIDSLKKAHNAVTKSKDMVDLAKQVKSQKALKLGGEIKEKLEEFDAYLKNAVENTSKQQLEIWQTKFDKEAQKAAVKKIKGEVKWKKRKAVFTLVVKGALVLGAAALTIAASAATFGTLPAAMGIISVTCASLGGLRAVYQTHKEYRDATNLEAAAIKKIEADLEKISIHLGKTHSATDGLPKHLDDASRFHTVRREALQKTQKKIESTDTELDRIRQELDKIKKVKGMESQAVSLVNKIQGLENSKKKAVAKIEACMSRDEELKNIFIRAKALVGDLEKLKFTGPKSKSIKERLNKEGRSITANALDMANEFVDSATALAAAFPKGLT